jgi:transformation/transcription domain-associated protein
VEEGHHMPQLIHIWNLIIRHSDLFYESRTQFVPQMVNSLNRLGLPPTRPVGHRRLAIDLAELIIEWDARCAINEMSADPATGATDETQGHAKRQKTTDDTTATVSASSAPADAKAMDVSTPQGAQQSPRVGTRNQPAVDGVQQPEIYRNANLVSMQVRMYVVYVCACTMS